MSAKTYGFQTGMKVYIQRRRWNGVPTSVEDLSEQTITKIGNKWITLGNGDRFCPERMQLDGKGYGFTDKVWTSISEFTDSLTINQMWKEFRAKLTHDAPKGLSVNDLKSAAGFLGIQLTMPVQDVS